MTPTLGRPWNVKFAEETTEPGYAARGPGERPVGVEALPGEGLIDGRPLVRAETE